jgi:hypothetical protein
MTSCISSDGLVGQFIVWTAPSRKVVYRESNPYGALGYQFIEIKQTGTTSVIFDVRTA